MYLDQNIITSFFQTNSFLVTNADTEGIARLFSFVDNIIYQRAKLKAETPDKANKTLQLYACCLFAYLVVGKSKIDEVEMARRKYLFDWANEKLDAIASGQDSIIDDDGKELTTAVKTSAVVFSSTKRITGIL